VASLRDCNVAPCGAGSARLSFDQRVASGSLGWPWQIAVQPVDRFPKEIPAAFKMLQPRSRFPLVNVRGVAALYPSDKPSRSIGINRGHCAIRGIFLAERAFRRNRQNEDREHQDHQDEEHTGNGYSEFSHANSSPNKKAHRCRAAGEQRASKTESRHPVQHQVRRAVRNGVSDSLPILRVRLVVAVPSRSTIGRVEKH
jgi:hypothetical protein